MGSALKRIGCLQVTLTLRQPTIFNNIRLKGPGIDCSTADGDIVNIPEYHASPLRRTRSRFQPRMRVFLCHHPQPPRSTKSPPRAEFQYFPIRRQVWKEMRYLIFICVSPILWYRRFLLAGSNVASFRLPGSAHIGAFSSF